MARRKTKTLTEVELGIMQVVWQRGEATVQEIQDALAVASKPLALPSIRTMLAILQDKGYVTRRQDGRGFVYRPAVEKAEAERRMLADLLDRAFKGSAASLVAALVNARMVSRKDLDEAKALIEKRWRGGK
jgi:BlaI family transcriptional regulator, penicillinase repressor